MAIEWAGRVTEHGGAYSEARVGAMFLVVHEWGGRPEWSASTGSWCLARGLERSLAGAREAAEAAACKWSREQAEATGANADLHMEIARLRAIVSEPVGIVGHGSTITVFHGRQTLATAMLDERPGQWEMRVLIGAARPLADVARELTFVEIPARKMDGEG